MSHHVAHWEPNLLGCGGRWTVRANGWNDVEVCPDQKAASLRAAALNYADTELPYGMIGLDGTDLHWPRGYSGEVWIGSRS